MAPSISLPHPNHRENDQKYFDFLMAILPAKAAIEATNKTVFWTRILAVATIALAVATIVLSISAIDQVLPEGWKWFWQ